MAEDIRTYPIYDSILDTIRVRPAMYLGESSLTALYHFIQGYEMALSRWGSKKKQPEVPPHFADWVAYRLHLDSNWSGFWHKAILSRIRDEHQALLRFYELRDEFLRREAKVIATIRKDCRERKKRVYTNGTFVDRVEQFPESLSIVVYTQDPGFFVVAEDREHFFYSGWFFAAMESFESLPWVGGFEIHDQSTWDRLLAENTKYKKNLAERRARIPMKEKQAKKTTAKTR